MKSKVITIIKEENKIFIDTRITTVLETIDILAQAFIKECHDSALDDNEIMFIFEQLLTKDIQ